MERALRGGAASELSVTNLNSRLLVVVWRDMGLLRREEESPAGGRRRRGPCSSTIEFLRDRTCTLSTRTATPFASHSSFSVRGTYGLIPERSRHQAPSAL